MGKIERFEDIEAWMKARKLTGEIYRYTRGGPFGKDFGLRDQIRRSAVSVMANVAEGFGRKTNKDFAHFLYTAKSSAMEVISHLYVALDQEYIDKEKFASLKEGYEHTQRMLVNLIRYLESHPRSRSKP